MKKYNANGVVLHVVLTKKTDERCHHRRKKIVKNKTRINYFVRIILILDYIFKEFFNWVAYNIFNYRAALFVVKWFKILLYQHV